MPRPLHRQHPRLRFRTHTPIHGHHNRLLPRKVLPRQRPLRPHHLLRRPLRRDLTASVACAWSEIEQIIRRPYHLTIMLYQHQRVPQVAQVLQRLQQPAVVAWMQPDGWLIEHVQHTGQSTADLARQPNAL